MNDSRTQLLRIRKYWEGDQAVEAGRLVYESLTPNERPTWAAGVLKIVIDRSGIQEGPFEEILAIAQDKAKWRTAHEAFSRLRCATLQLDDLKRTRGLSEPQQLMAWALSLAELVAKVTYNATAPADEFDIDSGWWIADSLRGFVDLWRDEKFSRAAWTALLPPGM
jgi:hypothetical protein